MMKSNYQFLALLALTLLCSCGKGENDPAVSFRSREQRIVNNWELDDYTIDARQQDLTGTYWEYDLDADNTIEERAEGNIFGFPTVSNRKGTWKFLNDREDLEVTLDGQTENYEIIRLAHDELWLRQVENGETRIHKFEER